MGQEDAGAGKVLAFQGNITLKDGYKQEAAIPAKMSAEKITRE